jgi:divalent metal cation (Fe/Co/Zn/Cd) transporter
LGKSTLNTLLDAAPAGVSAEIQSLAGTTNGVLAIRQLRVRPAGPELYVDMTVDVARNTPAARLEVLRLDLAKRIASKFANADCTIQLNAVELDSESAFDKVAHIADRHDLKVHHLAVQSLNGRLAISFDVEMPADLSIAEAHDKATALESEIRDGLGADVEVESHIEPMQPNLLDGAAPSSAVIGQVEKTLQTLTRKEKALSDLHNVRVRSNSAGLYVHYHCRFAPELSIAAVHEISDRIEVALMMAMPHVKRVVAHAEPIGAVPHQL